MADLQTAPAYPIAPRNVVAVEHPMIIRNLENGLKTFGKGTAFSRVSLSSHMKIMSWVERPEQVLMSSIDIEF